MHGKVLLLTKSRETYWLCLRKFDYADVAVCHDYRDRAGIVSGSGEKFCFAVVDCESYSRTEVYNIRNMTYTDRIPFSILVPTESFRTPFDSRVPRFYKDRCEPLDFPDDGKGIPVEVSDQYVIRNKKLSVCSPPCEPCISKESYYKDFVRKIACRDDHIFLLGETGCGKGITARYIHDISSRHKKPFYYLNIASLNPLTIESELFGSTKSAYTDAEDKAGYFEMAAGGTLFIDEIGDLPPECQVKLFGVLDSRKFCRAGSTRALKLECRLIFATDASIKDLVRQGKFRMQLYWRLEKFAVRIPPLRERKEEIKSLAENFADSFGKRLNQKAMKKLVDYDWPGNIRQLESCIDRAALVSDGQVIEDWHIDFHNDLF